MRSDTYVQSDVYVYSPNPTSSYRRERPESACRDKKQSCVCDINIISGVFYFKKKKEDTHVLSPLGILCAPHTS